MPNFMKNRKVQYLIVALVLLTVLGLTLIMQHNIVAGIVAFIGLGLVIGILVSIDKTIRKQAESYVVSFSQTLERTRESALAELPIGVVLYNESNEVVWSNKFMKTRFADKAKMGAKLDGISEQMTTLLGKKESVGAITVSGKMYKIEHISDRKLIYLTDITMQVNEKKNFRLRKSVVAQIIIDNYDDATQGMDDQAVGVLNSIISSEISGWANENGIFIRKNSSDRYFALLNESSLTKIEADKFSVIDNVRIATTKAGSMATMSIGIGRGDNTPLELGKLAQQGVDLALGRGGDQVVIKAEGEKPKFYGGTTNPASKRARVRARVVSQALHDLIKTSKNVIVMGHKHPDIDVFGSGIGVLRIAESHNKKAYFVMDKKEISTSVSKLMDDVKQNKELYSKFIYEDQALDIASEGTLIVIVDTNKPSMVISEKLLSKMTKVVVIDHHRRGEETIENPILSYVEPYASSAAELITELIEYHPTTNKIEKIEATALLAGIMVDTKMFTNRTGVRTFDAASYLKLHGADMGLINNIFKEDMDSIVERNRLIEQVYFYKEGYAITKGVQGDSTDRVIVAKAADSLLSVDKVEASFVIASGQGNKVNISARSSGDVNVQLIMEKLNGGGHLSNAAAQMKGVTIAEAETVLKLAIDEYMKERK